MSAVKTGSSDRSARSRQRLPKREVLVLAPILALLLVFGVFPKLLTDRIDPTAQAVVAHVSPDHITDVGATGVVQANGSEP